MRERENKTKMAIQTDDSSANNQIVVTTRKELSCQLDRQAETIQIMGRLAGKVRYNVYKRYCLAIMVIAALTAFVMEYIAWKYQEFQTSVRWVTLASFPKILIPAVIFCVAGCFLTQIMIENKFLRTKYTLVESTKERAVYVHNKE